VKKAVAVAAATAETVVSPETKRFDDSDVAVQEPSEILEQLLGFPAYDQSHRPLWENRSR
jgi:hypothetical protein